MWYIGQKVVALIDHMQGAFKKGVFVTSSIIVGGF